jgi:uncharacterized protein YycO
MKMRKTILTTLSVLLIAGSAVQMTTASARASRHETVAATQQFRNSNNSIDSRASTWCSTEPGNPYNPQTDYQAWSAWRALGAWDSRNDCQ